MALGILYDSGRGFLKEEMAMDVELKLKKAGSSRREKYTALSSRVIPAPHLGSAISVEPKDTMSGTLGTDKRYLST